MDVPYEFYSSLEASKYQMRNSNSMITGYMKIQACPIPIDVLKQQRQSTKYTIRLSSSTSSWSYVTDNS